METRLLYLPVEFSTRSMFDDAITFAMLDTSDDEGGDALVPWRKYLRG